MAQKSRLKLALMDIYLLLNKNFTIQYRHPILTFFEVIVPSLLILLVAVIRTKVTVTPHPNATTYNTFDINRELPDIMKKDFTILYTPSNNLTDQIMEELTQEFNQKCFLPYFDVEIPCFYGHDSTYKVKHLGFNSTDKMEKTYMITGDTNFILCAVEFGNLVDDNIEFTLRFSNIPKGNFTGTMGSLKIEDWKTNMVMKPVMPPGPRQPGINDGGLPGYHSEGFLYIQHKLSMTIAKILYNDTKYLPEIELNGQRFPYPKYTEDTFLFTLNFLFPSIFMFSFMFASINLTKTIVNEKERRLKESMKMMGLKEKYHFIAYFIKSILLSIPGILLIILFLKIRFSSESPPILISETSVLFSFFFLYEISNICFSFMVSTFFTQANLAGIITGILFFLTYMPYYSLLQQYNFIAPLSKRLNCLLPNTNMSLGVFIILMRETRGIAVKWSNVGLVAIPNDSLTLAFVFIMHLVNSVIYLVVTWYMTLAFPGQYGVPLPWYFPFSKKYWLGDSFHHGDDISSNGYSKSYSLAKIKKFNMNTETIETYPSNLRVGVSIQSLQKTFDRGETYAVKNLSFDMFEGQITALLGHNGAGKTTTISMLCGLFPPTAGTALVNGYDVRHEMNSVRSSLGICPQSNLLFNELTVQEHLEFYCKLKHTNLTQEEINKDVEAMVKKLDLMDKFKVPAENLSGGMKRKLSVGIALIGGSKIVILDEPTSGMDVSARRFIWDLLLQEKKNRVIMISTHFMEEADILGDRIAIMDQGQLRCYGSPLFLKNRFGSGYHLRMEKKNINSINTLELTKIVYDHVPNAKLESSVGIEVTYSLPSDQIKHFEPLLSKIETELSDKIVNYGISITTMEEVFLKVGQHNQNKTQSLMKKDPKQKLADGFETIQMESINNNEEYSQNGFKHQRQLIKNTGFKLIGQQFYALLSKRLIYSYRNLLLTLVQFSLPLLIIVATLLMIRSIPQFNGYKKLDLSLNEFHRSLVKYYVNENNSALPIAEIYGKQLRKELGPEKVQQINNTKDYSNDIISVNNYVYNYEFFISALFSFANDSKNELEVISLFNNQPFHTPAISLKYVDQALISYFYDKPNLKLNVYNYPMPMTINETLRMSQGSMGPPSQLQIIQAIIMGISFFVSSFAILIVKERVVKAKHLQKICGLRMSLYWMSLFLIDFLFYLITVVLIIVTLQIFKVENLHEGKQWWYLFVGMSLCGCALLPFVYVVSFIFNVPATAYARLNLLLILTGMTSLIVDQLTAIKELDLLNVNHILRPLFQLFLPLFDISKIITDVQTNFMYNKICHKIVNVPQLHSECSIQELCGLYPDYHNYSKMFDLILPCCKDYCRDQCLNFQENYFAWEEPGIGKCLLFVMANMMIYWIGLVMIEYNLVGNVKSFLQKLYTNDKMMNSSVGKNIQHLIDQDVQKEKNVVKEIANKNDYSQYSLVIDSLVKRYGQFTAVNDISYSVNRGECFGLLGVNGAGKTTTFKMITCDETITSGDIFINGFSVKKDKYKTLGSIGYCPQFDALLGELTGEETLRFYCRLRGIEEKRIQEEIKYLADLLYFEKHLHKPTENYSGGNKRKLSTAISILGNPAVSFLDEPTSGVDPVARRCLWEAIGEKLQQNVSIVLTSHSMEECEALCNRLIIMVNGQLCCIGSPLHLKLKFGNSYNLIIKVSTAKSNRSSQHQDPNESQSQIEQSSTETMTTSFIIHRSSDKNSSNDNFENQTLEQRITSIKKFIEKTFPNSHLKAIHNNMLDYTIQQHNNRPNEKSNKNGISKIIKCSEIFGIIEANKQSLHIEDYSVSQTNLEQIFLSFARNQRELNCDD